MEEEGGKEGGRREVEEEGEGGRREEEEGRGQRKGKGDVQHSEELGTECLSPHTPHTQLASRKLCKTF